MLKETLLLATLYLLLSCKQPVGALAAELDIIKSKAGHIAFKSTILNVPPLLVGFVPKGYAVLDTAFGNLNLDEYVDVIMVLKKKGEEVSSSYGEGRPEKRTLLILIGLPNQAFQLAAQNYNAVYCIDCGGAMGDPFNGIVIKNGFFSIEHYGGSAWRWWNTSTFKYSPSLKLWLLHKDVSGSFHAPEGEEKTTIKTSKDFGKVPFEGFDIYKH